MSISNLKTAIFVGIIIILIVFFILSNSSSSSSSSSSSFSENNGNSSTRTDDQQKQQQQKANEEEEEETTLTTTATTQQQLSSEKIASNQQQHKIPTNPQEYYSQPVSPESPLEKKNRHRDYKKFLKAMSEIADSRKTSGNFQMMKKQQEETTRTRRKPMNVDDLLPLINPRRNMKEHGDTVLIPPPGACPFYRPRFSKDADSKSAAAAVEKYSRYAKDFCNSSGMLQMHFNLENFIRIIDVIGSIVKLRGDDDEESAEATTSDLENKNNNNASLSTSTTTTRRMRVFEAGAGCGTMLNYYSLKYGIEGVGVDLAPEGIKHALQHARPGLAFCQFDITLLKAFPSNSFDAAVSWATLYHVRRTQVQCSIVMEMCRMLRAGGIAFIGHLRTEKTQNYWRKSHRCPMETCTWRRISDAAMFRNKSWKRHMFFSLYMKKLTEKEVEERNRILAATNNNKNSNNTVDAASPEEKDLVE